MSKISILTVDDAAFIRDLVKRSVRGFFPEVHIDEAPNGKRAQSLLQRNQYDLILCDWEMPEMSGLEVLTWLRDQEAEDGLPKTPFIMVTSRGDKANVVQAVEAGVTDYIGKPFSNEQLLKKAIRALSRDHKAYIAGLLTQSKQHNPFEKPPKASQAPKGASSESAQNLLTKNSTTQQVLTKSAPTKRSKLKSSNKGSAQFRTADLDQTCKIRDINLHEVFISLDRPEKIPSLFDQAVVDFEVKKTGDIARINGFIHTLSVPDKKEDAEIILLGVKFVDADPEKMEILSRFISNNG